MKTSDIMTLGAASIAHDAPLSQALRIMVDHRISALPVLDGNGHLLGIVTEGDFVRSGALAVTELLSMDAADRAKALGSRTVEKIMTRNPTTIGPDASVGDAIQLMERHALKRIPVASDGRVLGVISRADLLRMLIE